MKSLKSYDIYRHIPSDLTESTIYGNILTFLTIILIFSLLFYEYYSSFILTHYDIITYISSDNSYQTILPNTNTNIMTNNPTTSSDLFQINFNITLLEIPCSYAIIDILDKNYHQIDNLIYQMKKYELNKNGQYTLYQGMNPEEMELFYEKIDSHTMNNIYHNGIQAIEVNETEFQDWIENHPNVFINFYTPWCHWCQELEPIWELTAETVALELLPINLIKVNCEQNIKLCENLNIRAFPTLRLYRHHKPVKPDYHDHRTLDDFIKYIHDNLEIHPKTQQKIIHDDHVGCRVEGNLILNRIPGIFQLEARSWTQVINPLMTNISHIIHHLSFGPILSSIQLSELHSISEDYFLYSSLHPLDNQSFIVHELHRGYHHYIEAVPTTLEFHQHQPHTKNIVTYQLVQASQIMAYHEEYIPAVVFNYDISPISVYIRKKSKPWYDFITSMCAIIGGTVTILGLLLRLLTSFLPHQHLS